MRAWCFLAVLCLLAGCAGPAPSDVQGLPAPPQFVTPPLLVVANGTYTWHELTTTPNVATALVAYNVVTQTTVNPCSYGGSAYFNNRPIPTAGSNQPVRNGTLRIHFDWTDADYPQPTLVAGYRAPGMGNVSDSPRIARGQTIEIRIEGAATTNNDSWHLYACLNRSDETWGDPTWQPGPFVGAFTVYADFQGDPELAVDEPKRDGPRTSRS